MSQKITFHPAYLANRSVYQKHRDWLDSTPESLRPYIMKTMLEDLSTEDGIGEKYYQERLRFLDTDNDIHSLMKVHHSDLIKDQPTWGGLDSDQAQTILKDIDGKRTTVWKFTKNLFWQSIWAGLNIIETTGPQDVGETAAEAKANRERSYSWSYEPDDLVYWRYFEDGGDIGMLAEVVLLNKVHVDGDKHYQTYKRFWREAGSSAYSVQYLRCTKTINDTLMSSEVECEIDPDRPEAIGQLPFLPITIIGDPVEGVQNSPMYRLTNDAKMLLNMRSIYDRAGRAAGYERNIIFAHGIKDQETFLLNETVWGKIDDPEGSIHTLNPADPIAMWRRMENTKQSIRFKGLMHNNQGLNPESKESPSVESKESDKETRKNYYNDLTDDIEAGLDYLFGTVHAAFEPTAIIPGEVNILFRREFEMKDYAVEQADQAMLWSWSSSLGEAGTEAKKRLAITKLLTLDLATLEDEDEDEIKAELAKMIREQKIELVMSPTASAFNRGGFGGPQPPPPNQNGLNGSSRGQEREAARKDG